MISFEALHNKIVRQYPKVLKAYVLQEDVFPIDIAAEKSLPADFGKWSNALSEIVANSADARPFGYTITYETKQMRNHGLQTVPVRFSFLNAGQLVGYLNKQLEYENFKADVEVVLECCPALKNWIAANVLNLIKHHGVWSDVLKVLKYFLANHQPQLFIRQLPIGVHTKFVEQYKGLIYELLNEILPPAAINSSYSGLAQFELRFGLKLPPGRIRIRVLDLQMANLYFGGFTDLELTIEQLAAKQLSLARAFVLENKKNFENADVFCTLPSLQRTIVFYGSGKAAALLSQIPWLTSVPMIYWGDIDAEGFEILNMLRGHFPQIKSVLMDSHAFQSHLPMVTTGNEVALKPLERLTEDEMTLYQTICRQRQRLEQELLANDFVQNRLSWLDK